MQTSASIFFVCVCQITSVSCIVLFCRGIRRCTRCLKVSSVHTSAFRLWLIASQRHMSATTLWSVIHPLPTSGKPFTCSCWRATTPPKSTTTSPFRVTMSSQWASLLQWTHASFLNLIHLKQFRRIKITCPSPLGQTSNQSLSSQLSQSRNGGPECKKGPL